MRLAVIVSFLNEERVLPTFLESLARQTRPPDGLVLVDDGSRDASPAMAEAFAARAPYVRVIGLPRRSPGEDRLAGASELRAFQTGAASLEPGFDVVAKLDADLDLPSRCFAEILEAFDADPVLGLAGVQLSVRGSDGALRREHCPPDHVRGATRFYRRQCFDDVSPIVPFLGWDTIDETRAKMHGWTVRSLELSEGDPVHMRPTGGYDGAALRGFRRTGHAAWAYGSSFAGVLAGTGARMRRRPRVVGGVAFFWGWLRAAVSRERRADAPTRSFFRAQQRRRMWRALARQESTAA
jgi:poly-beta-1,6-N-acetyl-D-glucosamine synthase